MMQPQPPIAASGEQPAAPPLPVKQENAELAAVSLTSKIPDFWRDQPRVWFIRTEAILSPQRIGDNGKFDIVVTKLGKEEIQQVTDILTEPPEVGKYDALKSRLLAVYEESESRQLRKLLSEMELGEQKPSQLLRRMKDLARGKMPDKAVLMLWQDQLPPSARAVLAAAEITDLDKLSNIADKVLETAGPAQVASVAHTPDTGTDKLLAEIAKINLRLDEFGRSRSRQQRNFNRQRSQSRGRSSTPAGSSQTRPNKFCFYHFRFRERAKKCSPPCAWKNPGN